MASLAASRPWRKPYQKRRRFRSRQRCERRSRTVRFGESRPSLGAFSLASASSGLVGEALADNALERLVGAHGIVNAQRNTSIVAEIKLLQVAVEVTLATVLVNALHAALKDREVAFDRVRGGGATDVFLGLVAHNLMAHELGTHRLVDVRLVGVQRGRTVGIAVEDRLQRLPVRLVDMERANLAAALDKSEHDALVMEADAGVGLAFLLADVGLVRFKMLAGAAQRIAGATLHGMADAVRQEPRRLKGDAQHAMKLVAAHALLAGVEQVNGLQPQVQRDMAGLENGPDLDREGLAALVALPDAQTGGLALECADLGAVGIAAMGAGRAVRPDAGFDVGQSGGFVVEVRGGEDRLAHASNLGVGAGYVKYNIAVSTCYC